mgnify:FL=1
MPMPLHDGSSWMRCTFANCAANGFVFRKSAWMHVIWVRGEDYLYVLTAIFLAAAAQHRKAIVVAIEGENRSSG